MSDQGSIAADHASRDPYTDRSSLEFQFRARRFAKVRMLIEEALAENGKARILDLGGTETYWLIGEDFIRENRNRLEITLVNLEAEPARDTALFKSMAGDAADPALFSGEQYDVVHSNSVIEHVGDWEQMSHFAGNTRRLAKRYYVQTPNYWFPYEPHFRFPGFQYLPESTRVAMIQRFALGFFERVGSKTEAEAVIAHHRLVSTREMRHLFPDAEITHEKVMGMNKSIIAVRHDRRGTA